VRENINAIKKNTEALLDASKEVGPVVNPEKIKYMLMSRSQKAGQKHSIKIANRSFEDVAKFKYLGTTLKGKNCIHEEIKSRLNSGNACCRSVQSLLSSRPLSGNVKVKIYNTIILAVVLYGCETWSLILRKEHRLRVFENRVLRGMFGPKGDEVTGERRKLHSGELRNLYKSPNIVKQIKAKRMRLAGHVACKGEDRKLCKVLGEKLEGKRPLGKPRSRWEDGIKLNVRKIGWGGVDSSGSGTDQWRYLANTR
jgi:hypothetical protein